MRKKKEKKKTHVSPHPPKMQRTAIGHLLDLPTRNISPAPNWSSSSLRKAAHTYQSKTAYPAHEKQSKTSRTFTTPFPRYNILTATSTNHASDPITIPSLSALPWIASRPVPGSQKTNSKGGKEPLKQIHNLVWPIPLHRPTHPCTAITSHHTYTQERPALEQNTKRANSATY